MFVTGFMRTSGSREMEPKLINLSFKNDVVHVLIRQSVVFSALNLPTGSLVLIDRIREIVPPINEQLREEFKNG